MTAPLGKVADVQLGKMLDRKRTEGTNLPYLRNVNVRWGHIDVSDLLEMPFRDHELDRYAVRPGDVMVCEGGEPGRAAVWTRDDQDIKYQKALHRVRVGSGLLPNWLVYQLHLDASRGRLAKHFTGTTIGHLPREAIVEYELRLAPVPEQHRIVEAIESYFTRLDDAVATLKRVQRNLKRYRASVLKAAVEGRLVPTEAGLARAEGRDYEPASVLLERILAERRRRWQEAGGRGKYQEPVAPDTTHLRGLPEGWCWATIGIVGDVRLGRQRAPQHHVGPNMRPYLRVANVFEDRIETADVMEMNFGPADYETYRLKTGDILLNEGQSPHLVGRPAMYRGEVPGACFQNTLVRFRSRPAVDPAYALIVFRAQLHSLRYLKIAKITTNIAHLGAERFSGVEFPLPPLAEQHRIVTFVDDALSLAAATERTIHVGARRCSRLRQAILKWAFEGKLANQDPSDEPATALLERIQSQTLASRLSVGDPEDRRRRRSGTRRSARAENKP
jgi:type I restriction enzyme S subunit